MGKVDFIEIDTLANYVGIGGRIIVYEFDIRLGTDYLDVKLIKSNGENENIRCSVKLTKLIHDIPEIVKYLPYFIVIETSLKRKSISINRVAEEKHNLTDYILEFHPFSETIELLESQKAEWLKQKEENENQANNKTSADDTIN